MRMAAAATSRLIAKNTTPSPMASNIRASAAPGARHDNPRPRVPATQAAADVSPTSTSTNPCFTSFPFSVRMSAARQDHRYPAIR